MNNIKFHDHPYASTNYIIGILLQPGAILEANDVYASTTGRWTKCPCPGITLSETETIWVRPISK